MFCSGEHMQSLTVPESSPHLTKCKSEQYLIDVASGKQRHIQYLTLTGVNQVVPLLHGKHLRQWVRASIDCPQIGKGPQVQLKADALLIAVSLKDRGNL